MLGIFKWRNPSGTKTYRAWAAMRNRCHNPDHPQYRHYGGRGITVCDAWRASYDAFHDDMGAAPPGLSLERIDNDGNYEPGNCRWATQKDQRNNTRQNRVIELNGVSRTVQQWAEHLGVSRTALQGRLERMSPEEALKPGSRRPTLHHGSITLYSRGCRCGDCLNAYRTYQGVKKARAAGLDYAL